MFLALCAGATLYLAEQDPQSILELLRTGRITHAVFPTSTLSALPVEPFPALRTIGVGGEPCPASLVKRWIEGRRFFNFYGPTETTIYATVAECKHDGRNPSIGRPICNTRVYVLDALDRPVPVGAPGELHIAGPGVARGYLNDPQLTAQKFIADPFTDEPGARMYKTGDRCRFLPDGNLEFLGRLDDQVKIRGFRIEPAEIELLLLRHPAVKDCVVVPQDDKRGALVLYALIVRAPRVDLSARELRLYLREHLPTYMVPSHIHFLKRLPLNPHGKVDRRGLSEIWPSPARDERSRIEASLPWERELGLIFEEVLDHRPISVNDDFFDLGGQSLLAGSVVVKIEQTFGRKLSLAKFLEAPTIARLAALLRTDANTDGQWASLVPIQPHGTKPPLFLVHGAGGNVLLYRYLAKHLAPDYPLYGLQSRGLDGQTDPLETIEEMAEHYLREIRTVKPTGPYFLGGYCMGGTVAYEMAQRLSRDGEHVGLLALLYL